VAHRTFTLQQLVVLFDPPFPPGSRATDAFDGERVTAEIVHGLIESRPRNAADAGDQSNAPTAQLRGIGSSHQMLLSFGQMREQESILLFEFTVGVHARRLHRPMACVKAIS
jgi:hypothetical protein